MATKHCADCKHCGWDPDGSYCAHPIVLRRMPYGAALYRAIPECDFSDEAIKAGTEHPLFEPRTK